MSTRCHCGLLFQTINNCYAFIYISVDDSKDPSRITALRHEPAEFLGDGWVFRLVSSSLRCRSISSSYRTMVFSNSLSISSAAVVSLSPMKSLRDWTEDMAADKRKQTELKRTLQAPLWMSVCQLCFYFLQGCQIECTTFSTGRKIKIHRAPFLKAQMTTFVENYEHYKDILRRISPPRGFSRPRAGFQGWKAPLWS